MLGPRRKPGKGVHEGNHCLDRRSHPAESGRGIPRLPLEGNIDLTYRCNNRCRHCWLRLPVDGPAAERELSFDEIRRIAGEARALGCRRWLISGGEPILRPDFAGILDLLTHRSLPYSLNTNGTLITPVIANLLKRKGSKMVALYGATAATHDHITRTPGSFEAALRGMAYLREAGAGFIVQLIPMRANHHEFDAMVHLARSLSPVYRMGAPWLFLSACRSANQNREISRQRLDPADAILLEPPDCADDDERMTRVRCGDEPSGCFLAGPGEKMTSRLQSGQDQRPFAPCIEGGRDFHIDPCGGMTFCCFIKDPALRYDLRSGHFREAWEEFLPSLSDRVRADLEYEENCGRCENRKDCRWCPAYAYLEHGRYGAKIEYLCGLAHEARSYGENWRRTHRRYFRIADVTVRVDSDVPFTEKTLEPKFGKFETDGPSEEMIVLRHHFTLPEFNREDLGVEVYRRAPWAIYRKDRSWIYLGIGPGRRDADIHCAAVFNEGHTRGRIYNPDEARFRQGNLHALTLFPSDQILLARAFADRRACFFHAAGLDLGGKGILLVGHSDAGKTTAARILQERGTVLCDDRIVVSSGPDGLRMHGTWSHGDLADVSAGSAPLAAICFLEKAHTNRLVPLKGGIETARLLALHVVKGLVTADWWEKVLALIDRIARETPAYRLMFDRTGRMADTVGEIL